MYTSNENTCSTCSSKYLCSLAHLKVYLKLSNMEFILQVVKHTLFSIEFVRGLKCIKLNFNFLLRLPNSQGVLYYNKITLSFLFFFVIFNFIIEECARNTFIHFSFYLNCYIEGYRKQSHYFE